MTTISGSLFYASKPASECNSLMVVGTVGNARNRLPVDSVLAFKWFSAMLLLRSPFLVARLCSFSRVVKFLPVSPMWLCIKLGRGHWDACVGTRGLGDGWRETRGRGDVGTYGTACGDVLDSI